eukprot:IDg6903t1
MRRLSIRSRVSSGTYTLQFRCGGKFRYDCPSFSITVLFWRSTLELDFGEYGGTVWDVFFSSDGTSAVHYCAV